MTTIDIEAPLHLRQPQPNEARIEKHAEAKRRTMVIEAARMEFAQLGYTGTSILRIAARAGIKKSSLFHHFSSKRELYDAAVGGLVNEMFTALSRAAMPGTPFEERLERCIAVLHDYSAQPYAGKLLLRAVLSDDDGPERLAGASMRGIVEAVASIVQAGIDEGVVPGTAAGHLALSALGAQLLFFAGFPLHELPMSSATRSVVEDRLLQASLHVRRMLGLVPPRC